MTGRGYMRWTPDLVVLHIRAWIAMTGCAPAYRDFDAALGWPSPSTVKQHCGSWGAALRLAYTGMTR